MNILILGGASGLGELITRSCAQDMGNKVYFTYNSSIINANKIEVDFPNTIAIKCDFNNTNDIEQLSSEILNLGLDVLVNNAYSGTFINSHFHKIAPSDFLTEFKSNIIPTITLTQAAITSFRKKKQGKIITILTAALVNTPPIGSAIYVANKAYLKQLSKIWAIENAKFNITSNTISPSLMQTRFTSEIDNRTVEQITSNHPLKKLLTPGEVAETVLYLLNASSHVNGIDIVINAAADIN